MNVPKLPFTRENLLGPFTRQAERLWEWAEKFNNLGNVVVVLAILRARLRVEEIVASDQFEDLCLSVFSFRKHKIIPYHASHAPDVCTCTPFATKYDFRRPILPGLDVVGEMVGHPASIPKVSYLDRYGFDALRVILTLRGVFVERDSRYRVRKVLSVTSALACLA